MVLLSRGGCFEIYDLFLTGGQHGDLDPAGEPALENGNHRHSLQYAFILTFAYPIAPLLATGFADRFERKWIICAGAAIIIFGRAVSELTQPLRLIGCGTLLAAANMTMFYPQHAYQPEVSSTAIRARSAGLAHSISRISATFSGFIVAFMLKQSGGRRRVQPDHRRDAGRDCHG